MQLSPSSPTEAHSAVGKNETFTLTRPDTEGLPVDASALEEFLLGAIPCVRVRDGAGQSLDPNLQPGKSATFQGKLTLINLPAGCRRVDSPDWNEDMRSQYDGLVVRSVEHSDLLFLLYDLAAGAADAADQYATRAADYCETASSTDSGKGLRFLGKDNPCETLFRSGGSAFVVSWDYYNHLAYKPELRDLLRDKYFHREGKAGDGSASEAPVKLLCGLIPGRSLVWVPVIGPEPPNFAGFLKGEVLEAYHLTFLDGPNIYITRLVDTPW